MSISLTRCGAAILAMLLAAVAVLVAAPLGAAADEAPSTPPKLGIAPADRPGSWFDLELEAGDSEHLSIELANHGDQPLDVASYAADVYTLVGGGMGVGLRDEPTAGTTAWLDYPTRVEHLAPDEAVRRTVTVAVPDDTEPGQYIAALVIENDQPLAADGELSVERIVRQAVAVNITVPGPARPALTIGDASHTLTAGDRSVIRLEIDNPGNRHLKPAGTLTLTDDTGTILASRDVTMESIYAGTTTHLELTLDDPLTPGIYTLAAELSDADHDVHAVGNASFEIVAPPLAERLVPGLDRVIDSIEASGLPAWAILTAAVLLLALLPLLIVAVRRRRRRAARRANIPVPPPTRPAPPVAATAPPPTVPPPPGPPPLFDHFADLRAIAEPEPHMLRAAHPDPAASAPPASSTQRDATAKRPARTSATAAPSQPPTRTTQQPVAAGAPTGTRPDTDDPASRVLFTARPPRRRRRR